MLSEIALIIPTKNNFKKVSFLLNFYNEQNFSGTIYLADSSKKKIFDELDVFISKNKFAFKIFHINTFGFGVSKSIMKLKKLVHENYCLQTGDDDYIFLNGLKKCLNYLKLSKNEIISCSGRGYFLNPNTKKKFFQYSINSLLSDDYMERVYKFINSGLCVQWGLTTKDIFFKIWNNEYFNNNNYIGSDILPAFKLCLLGKVGFIDDLYIIHMFNENNMDYHLKIRRDFFAIDENGFKQANKICKSVLGNQIIADSNIFEIFYLKLLSKKLNYFNNSTNINLIKKFVNKFKFLINYFLDKKKLNMFLDKISSLNL